MLPLTERDAGSQRHQAGGALLSFRETGVAGIDPSHLALPRGSRSLFRLAGNRTRFFWGRTPGGHYDPLRGDGLREMPVVASCASCSTVASGRTNTSSDSSRKHGDWS